MCKRSQGINLVITEKKTTNQFIHCGELRPKTAVHMSQKKQCPPKFESPPFFGGEPNYFVRKGQRPPKYPVPALRVHFVAGVSPLLLIAKISLQRLLLIAGVTRYLEFKSIEGSYVMGKSGKISKVGFCSRY